MRKGNYFTSFSFQFLLLMTSFHLVGTFCFFSRKFSLFMLIIFGYYRQFLMVWCLFTHETDREGDELDVFSQENAIIFIPDVYMMLLQIINYQKF